VKKRQAAIFVLVIGFIVLQLGLPPLSADHHEKVRQEVLFENNVELPSKNVHVKIRRATFPVGYKTAEHTHKGPGPRYLLKGELEVVEAGTTRTFRAGEVFWESGVLMTAENVGSGEAEIVIIELLTVE